MLECANLEIHVTYACNLFCKSCSHFSDQNIGHHVSLERLADEMGQWSGRIKPKHFSILGGEPTLNPDLARMVRECRRHWPFSKLLLVTNGFFLHRHPELPRTLEETKCALDVSIHHAGKEYSAKVQEITRLLTGWKEKHNFVLKYRPSSDTWRTTFRGSGAKMIPWEDQNPDESYRVCFAKNCPQIFEGKIYKCPQLAYLPLVDRKYGLSPDWDKYLSYRPLYPTCSDEELRRFFSQKAEPYCGMCPAYHRFFKIPSPLKKQIQGAVRLNA